MRNTISMLRGVLLIFIPKSARRLQPLQGREELLNVIEYDTTKASRTLTGYSHVDADTLKSVM